MITVIFQTLQFFCKNNIIFNTMRRNMGQTQPLSVFFERSNQELLNIYQQSQKQFQANFTQFVSFISQKKISIIDEYLVISEKIIDEFKPVLFKKLDQNLKFKRIDKIGASKIETPQVNGITLFNNINQSVSLYFQYQSILNIFIERLSNLIMRVGFFEDYKIIEKVGKGSTAVVYKIMRIKDQKVFSAKTVLKAYLQGKQQRKLSFLNQILMLRVLDHDNILKIEEVYDQQTHFYIVTEHLNGGTLLDRVNRYTNLSLREIKIIIKSIAEGLAYMHKYNIMHRDIKLENLMFRSCDSWEAVIVDFGIAQISDDQPYILYRCGTPGYIAPQIILMSQKQKIDVKCDIFSTGIILHILLTKKYLFQDSSSSQIYKKNRQFGFDLESPFYKGLDSNGLELMKVMLELDAEQRISGQQILNHSFLQFQESSQKKQDIKTPSTISQYEWFRL